ncbi:hypothetical protein HMPREF2845_04670 [Rothia sp. HMSC065B04]|nr:hypothetical protein HMPREF2845_04670 [Rothia sp. HMSC065B04]
MIALLQVYAKKTAGDINKYSKNIFGLDEPETWLHPRAQIKLIKAVREISKSQQVILVTHSPYMLQDFAPDNSNVIVLGESPNGGRAYRYTELNKCKLPYISWNAINYYVFGVPSVEFMDELYGEFQKRSTGKEFAGEAEICEKLKQAGAPLALTWKDNRPKFNDRSVPVSVYVRNSVHHPESKNKYTSEQLLHAIQELELAIIKYI